MKNIQIKWNLINSYKTKFTSSFTSKSNCSVCFSRKYIRIQNFKKFQFFIDSNSPKKINVENVMCEDCYAVYQNPSYNKKGLKNLFSEAGMSYGSTASSKIDQINWLRKNKLIKKNLKILDVGCYDGSFLKMLPKNIKKFGLDIDKNVITKAKKKNKDIKFFFQNFETFKSKTKFDLIVMMHVLEHLRNPLVILKNLKNVSDDNTNLVIEVPILENHMSNKLDQLDGFITIQHITHFTQKSLSNIITQSGWKIVKQKKLYKYNGYRIICKKNNNKLPKLKVHIADKNLFKKYIEKYDSLRKKISTKIKATKFSNNSIIYGAGLHLEILYHVTNFFEKNFNKKFIILDGDPLKIGRTWRGIKIYNPKIISSFPDLKKSTFIISSYPYQPEIEFFLKSSGVKKQNIFKFYEKIKRY